MKYLFSQPESLIKDVEIFAAGKQLQAILHAPEEADADRLSRLKISMEQNGFNVLADHEQGKDILRISGFKSAESFLNALASDGGVSGNYAVEITEREIKEKKTFGDLLKDNALTVSGWLYVTADTFVIGSSLVRGALEKGADKSELFNGILWWIPSFFLIAAGHQDPNVVEGFLKRDLKQELDNHNIHLPSGALRSMEDGAAGNGLWDKFVEFVYANGPAMNNVMQMMGGQQMFMAGLPQNQGNLGKMLAGALVFTGMGAGLFLPEHQREKQTAGNLGIPTLSNADVLKNTVETVNAKGRDSREVTPMQDVSDVPVPKTDKGPIGNFIENINPLAYSGTLATGNNVLNIFGAVNEISEFTRGKTWWGGTEPKLNILKHNQPVKGRQDYLNDITQLEQKYNADLQRFDARRVELESQYLQQGNQLNAPDIQQQIQSDEQYRQLEALRDRTQGELHTAQNLYKDKARSASASYLNLAASVIYMAANRFYAMSSKENSADLAKIGAIDNVMSIAANVIAVHPKEEREALTERMATMLSDNKYIDSGIQEISSTLKQKVTALEQSPWLRKDEQFLAANNAVPFTRRENSVAASEKGTPDNSILEAQRQSLERLINSQIPSLTVH